jgi:formylmethanofuran dehydrogenase subunit E-like metal-binding protein
MSIELLPTQRGSIITSDGIAEEEHQVWIENITECVNDFTGGLVAGSITINGILVNNLTLEGRSTEFVDDGSNAATFTLFENFSYNKIPVNETVTIPVNQQMIVEGTQDIFGTLIIDGSMSLI